VAHEMKIQKNFADYIVGASREIENSIEPRHLKRLSVYRNNFVLNGEETLSQIFPVTRMVLGQRRFFEYSGEYTERFSAASPNREKWGDEFPAFISRKASEHQLGFLYDLSRLELHLFEASRAESAVSLAAKDLADTVQFKLIPSVYLVESPFRVDELYEVHVTGQINNIGTYDIRSQPCCLVIFQKDGVSAYAAVNKNTFKFVSVLQEKGWCEKKLAVFGAEQIIEHLRHCLELGIISIDSLENNAEG